MAGPDCILREGGEGGGGLLCIRVGRVGQGGGNENIRDLFFMLQALHLPKYGRGLQVPLLNSPLLNNLL